MQKLSRMIPAGHGLFLAHECHESTEYYCTLSAAYSLYLYSNTSHNTAALPNSSVNPLSFATQLVYSWSPL